ncbi:MULTISPECIES: gas vesicle protein GvpG [Terribacillus]|uniref:Gas vesicle protein GvpG n=1 Tax=Terribacillus saccharophilus TaxID=361277 RepID=A0ABX4GZD4_9BACI|nr:MULTISPECIES: gas vesicle protein GvpG [Terribacillus]MEC0282117.1 gas vesicle protein GvpG [Terribacillus saccharophilus]MEC0289124.1 gas vesicle protein GvpG [Terribacillus saccharophilus]PAD36300.1 gas vesicle protein GvpG [Terribacillus saccharophilus]PAD96660.1 gas vesicle protein GvpG [Terribacillus saccharophilus]PAE00236.1 gas vesicle protein GvpG [Terribacillus saccharophilus]
MMPFLVSAPIKLLIKIGQKIKDEADKEYFDISAIQQKLIQLQMLYELEEISEEAYKEKEQELLLRYEVAKQRELDEWEKLAEEEDKE